MPNTKTFLEAVHYLADALELELPHDNSICRELYDLTGDPSVMQDVQRIAFFWPYKSGHQQYVIPATSRATPHDQFVDCLTNHSFWNGLQGQLRHDLVMFMRAAVDSPIALPIFAKTWRNEALESELSLNETMKPYEGDLL